MKSYTKPMLGAGLTVMLSFAALGAQAGSETAVSGYYGMYPSPTPKPTANTLPNCNNVIVGGVSITCPTDSAETRIIQVFNPALDKGTSTDLTCVCNATFTRCDPNKTAPSDPSKTTSTVSKKGELPACDIGYLRSVPSEFTLYGNNTSPCVTVGGVRTCYSRGP